MLLPTTHHLPSRKTRTCPPPRLTAHSFPFPLSSSLYTHKKIATVDYITDSQIQTTLKSAPAFQGCTIIVIAHRIRTVLDSDMVLVFSDGKLVEQGSPTELLADQGSYFADMVKEAEGGGGGADSAAAASGGGDSEANK